MGPYLAGPHCARRCSLQQDCANSSQPHFWTSASEGPSRCPTMALLPAEIDVRQDYPVSWAMPARGLEVTMP